MHVDSLLVSYYGSHQVYYKVCLVDLVNSLLKIKFYSIWIMQIAIFYLLLNVKSA